MKNTFTTYILLVFILVLMTLGFFSLKVYFSIQENDNYSGEFLTKDLFSSFIYAIGPFIISVIAFRKKLFKSKKATIKYNMKQKFKLLKIVTLLLTLLLFSYLIVKNENKLLFILLLVPSISGIIMFFKWLEKRNK